MITGSITSKGERCASGDNGSPEREVSSTIFFCTGFIDDIRVDYRAAGVAVALKSGPVVDDLAGAILVDDAVGGLFRSPSFIRLSTEDEGLEGSARENIGGGFD